MPSPKIPIKSASFLVAILLASTTWAACDNTFSEDGIKKLILEEKNYAPAIQILKASIKCKDNVLARYYLGAIYYLQKQPSMLLNALQDGEISSYLHDENKKHNVLTMSKWARDEIAEEKKDESSITSLINCRTTDCSNGSRGVSKYEGELSIKQGQTMHDINKAKAIQKNHTPLSKEDIVK